jgi:hypothetical protein
MIPPFFTSCSSSGCTSTRSPRGLTLTAAIGFRLLLGLFLGYAGDPETFGAVDKFVDQSKLVRAFTQRRGRRGDLVAAFCGDGLPI